MPTFGDQIRGAKTGRANLFEEAARVQAAGINPLYESHEFSLTSPQTNLALTALDHTTCTCGRDAFDIVTRGQRVYIRNRGTTTLTLRLNTTTSDPITLEEGEDLHLSFVEVTEIYLTNTTGSAISVKIVTG